MIIVESCPECGLGVTTNFEDGQAESEFTCPYCGAELLGEKVVYMNLHVLQPGDGVKP